MQLDKKYMVFYLNGRGDDVFDDEDDVDLDELADKAMDGEDPRKIALETSEKLAVALSHGKNKKHWMLDNEDAIKEEDLDGERAFEHYVQGRIDQYAHHLEDEIVAAMFEDSGDDEEEDDEDDDDDED